jgi:hypothetical protein
MTTAQPPFHDADAKRCFYAVLQGINSGIARFASQPGIAESLVSLQFDLSKPIERSQALRHILLYPYVHPEPMEPSLLLRRIPKYSNAISETIGLIDNAMSHVEWHPRALSVFSEVITPGTLSRAHCDEPPPRQIRLLNSWASSN